MKIKVSIKMRYLFYFVMLCISVNCHSNKKTIFNDPLLDSLLSEQFLAQTQQNEISLLLAEIIQKHPVKIDEALLYYLSNREYYKCEVLQTLVEIKSQKFLNWLQENGHTLKYGIEWQSIFGNAGYGKWNDTLLYTILLNNALNNKGDNLKIKADLIQFFSVNGTLKEILSLKQLLKTETMVRSSLFACLARFKYSDIDTEIKTLLNDFVEFDDASYIFENGLMRYNRYDFLPDLNHLKTKLQNEKDIRKIGQAQETLSKLNELIPYLEQKKAEKAQIGMPLDWKRE